MTLPTITPPPEYSRQVAWTALQPVRPLFENGLKKLVTGMNARTARTLFAQMGRHMTAINNMLAGGLLDGDIEWKGHAAAMLAEMSKIVAIATPIEQKYSEQTGELLRSSAAAGTVLSLEEASGSIVIEQVDIDTLHTAVTAALGD
jgi:hypothetical protein